MAHYRIQLCHGPYQESASPEGGEWRCICNKCNYTGPMGWHTHEGLRMPAGIH